MTAGGARNWGDLDAVRVNAPGQLGPVQRKAKAKPRAKVPTKRVTVDLEVPRYRQVRSWSLDAGLPASVLWAALLDEAGADPDLRARAEARGVDIFRERRRAG